MFIYIDKIDDNNNNRLLSAIFLYSLIPSWLSDKFSTYTSGLNYLTSIACLVFDRTRFSATFGLVIIKAKEYNDIGIILEKKAYENRLYDKA